VKTEWAGKAKTRYNKLHAKRFIESEVSELLHAISFQKHVGDDGGDSKGRDSYEKYVVQVPCDGFTPEREFELRYTWSEHGVQLARKAKADYNTGDVLSNSRAFHVDLRSEAVLKQSNINTAWIVYWTHIRAHGIESTPPQWRKTENPIMTELSGALNPVLAANVKATHLRGFRATFACGTRKEMHDLPVDDFTGADPHLKKNFAECLHEGKESNTKLREESPDASYLEEEVVVRMTIHELPACYGYMDPDKINDDDSLLEKGRKKKDDDDDDDDDDDEDDEDDVE